MTPYPLMRIKTPHQQRIEKFMLLAGQTVPDAAKPRDIQVRKLRARLILEEAIETINALGFSIYGSKDGDEIDVLREIDISDEETHATTLSGIIDGCCDLSVVTIGTLSAHGIADHEPLLATDINNLQKFGPGCSYRNDGKLIKPPGHIPVDYGKFVL